VYIQQNYCLLNAVYSYLVMKSHEVHGTFSS